MSNDNGTGRLFKGTLLLEKHTFPRPDNLDKNGWIISVKVKIHGQKQTKGGKLTALNYCKTNKTNKPMGW